MWLVDEIRILCAQMNIIEWESMKEVLEEVLESVLWQLELDHAGMGLWVEVKSRYLEPIAE